MSILDRKKINVEQKSQKIRLPLQKFKWGKNKSLCSVSATSYKLYIFGIA